MLMLLLGVLIGFHLSGWVVVAVLIKVDLKNGRETGLSALKNRGDIFTLLFAVCIWPLILYDVLKDIDVL